MKYLLIIACISIGARHCLAQHVVINEVMYAPIKPEPEWVELFNPSDSAVPIGGWTVSNHLRTYTLLPDTIAANGYLVITKDSVQFLKMKYALTNVNILQTTVPPLGNTGDLILFKDSLGNVIDSLRYLPSWGGANGTSLERIDYAAPTDSSNFSTTTDPRGGTPCAANSIARRDFDLALESLSYKAANLNDLAITATIENRGRKIISDGIVSLLSNSGLLLSQSQITVPIPPLQKQDIVLTWQNAGYGRTNITAFVNETLDELHADDTLRAQVYLAVPRNAVVINEIMPTPPTSSSQWIELYNNSANTANMDSTMFHIGVGSKIYNFLIDSLILAPKQYSLIIADSNFFTTFPSLRGHEGIAIVNKSDLKLKDSGNQIILVNSDSSVIDSLHSYASWYPLTVTNHSAISLERKNFNEISTDPNNWNSSHDSSGSTPLRRNSDVPDTTPVASMIDVQISPNPFSPDGDGFDDETEITITIPSDNLEAVTIRLYDLRGRLRSIIPLSQGISRTASVRFDGKDDNGTTLPIGLYTLVVESESGLFKPQRKGIVIIKKPR